MSIRLLGLLALTTVLSACSTQQTFTIDQPRAAAVATEETATAAAVAVDITPPPGIAKGAYSILGNKAIGFRTRLKARIFYLNDGKGQSIAMIQGDLAGSSLLMHHKVAALVAEKTGLKPGDIFITGTHSHSSFGNHFHNDFYNKHFSSIQGLEPELLEEISNRIAAGVLQAHKQRRPAKVATGRKDIYGYNRNRMLEAYRLNPGKGDLDLEDPETKFKEVNPSLYMVRIDALDDDGQYKPLGAFSSFSVHGTVISAPVRVYNGDLFAYAQRELEWDIQNKYQPSWQVLHGMTTGTQGDMAPAVKEGDNYFSHADVDFVAARALGIGIGKEAIALFNSLEKGLSQDVTVASAAREVNIRDNNKIADVELCDTPYVGTATAGGAYERRSPWLSVLPTLRGGWGSKRLWFGTDGCQGNKRILGTSWFQPLLEPTDSFPTTVLFQIVRVNDTLIMPLPFEMTTQSGLRAAAKVKKEFNADGKKIEHSWVTSVANGYFGYSVTPEEYQYQSYEGGSTMYGQYSTPYISAQLQQLAKDFNTQGEVEEMMSNWTYTLNITDMMPVEQAATGSEKILQQAEFVDTDEANEEDYYAVRFLGVNASKINLHQPLAHIEIKGDNGWQPLAVGKHIINDQGYDVEVRLTDEEDQGMAEYEVRWYNPQAAQAQAAGKQYRFVIQRRLADRPLVSEVVTL